MKKSKFNESQIIGILKQQETGKSVILRFLKTARQMIFKLCAKTTIEEYLRILCHHPKIA